MIASIDSRRQPKAPEDHERKRTTPLDPNEQIHGGADGTGQKQKQMMLDFPWVCREQLYEFQLEGSLDRN